MPSIVRYRSFGLWVGLAVLGCLSAVLLAWQEPRSARLAVNSLLLAAGTCALSLPVGTLVALLLFRTSLPGRKLLGLLLLGLLFVPLYLQAAGWQAGFAVQGWYTLAASGNVWLEGWRAAIWVHAAAAIPWVVLLVGVGLWFVQPELEEAALLDATAAKVFRRVTLRQTSGAVGAAALWVVVSTVGEMTVTDLFQVRTYAEELYTEVSLGGEVGQAPLAVLPGMLIIGWLVVAALALCVELVPVARRGSMRPAWTYPLHQWRWPLCLVLIVLLLVVVGVPVGNLLWKAGVLVSQGPEGRIRQWSLVKCAAIIVGSPVRYGREFSWSLLIGLSAATAVVVLAVPLAWWARRGGLAMLPALGATTVSLALPGPVIGVGLIWLLNRPDWPLLCWLYDRSILAPWAAQCIRALGPAVLVLWFSLRNFADETLESAALEGAGATTRWPRIILPQCWAALAAAWLVALAIALGDLAGSVLVVPPGVTTLAIRIFGLMHYGVDDQVAGICLAMLAGMLFLALVVAIVARQRLLGPANRR